MVEGTQRLWTEGSERYDAFPWAGNREGNVQQRSQKRGINVGHIAGGDEAPRLAGYLESGHETPQGTSGGPAIGNHVETQPGIACGVGDDGDVSDGLSHLRGHKFKQSPTVQREERLIASHAAALASGEDESGGMHAAGLAHEKMITPLHSNQRTPTAAVLPLSSENRMVYICFLLIWGTMTSTGVYAANAVASGHAAATVVRADSHTGRLVRSVIVNPKTIPAKVVGRESGAETGSGSIGVNQLVEEAAKSYDVDPLLVHSVIQVESNYNPYALSNKGAEGLMQLIPATARRFGVKNSFNSRDNIDAGVRYLKYLKNLFGDDRLALAAYNAGEAAVARYGWIPPYPETQQYVYRVGKKYGEARRAADRKPAPAPVAAVKPIVEDHPKLEQYRDEQGRVCFRTK